MGAGPAQKPKGARSGGATFSPHAAAAMIRAVETPSTSALLKEQWHRQFSPFPPPRRRLRLLGCAVLVLMCCVIAPLLWDLRAEVEPEAPPPQPSRWGWIGGGQSGGQAAAAAEQDAEPTTLRDRIMAQLSELVDAGQRLPWLQTAVGRLRDCGHKARELVEPLVAAGPFVHGMLFSFTIVLLVAIVISVGGRLARARQRVRPYSVGDLSAGDNMADPLPELRQVVNWIQDAVVRPLDERLPGRPFREDLHVFPKTPTVLVIGNHSSGKSTFINRLLGSEVQDTGVAPTDDGFTVIERCEGPAEVHDGPTTVGCPNNLPFRELQRFGSRLVGQLKRKRVVLPADSMMPYGLQIVDSPGMIDMPNDASGPNRRGYHFIEVVRWWAKHSDLILLLFDPDKPGTTGESLEVLTKSLAGLHHKFLIVMNKVDMLEEGVDFARVYGAFGWALSKVLPKKDMPMIHTMCNAGFDKAPKGPDDTDAAALQKTRSEIIVEVLRARVRHWDNVITHLEETLRQVEMTVAVLGDVRRTVGRRLKVAGLTALVALGLPCAVFRWLTITDEWWLEMWEAQSIHGLAALAGSYAFVCLAVLGLLAQNCRQYERMQVEAVDQLFERRYKQHFMHTDGEDLRERWLVVRPKVAKMLRALPTVLMLPRVADRDVKLCDEALANDIWYLRQLARLLREPTSGIVPWRSPQQPTKRMQKIVKLLEFPSR